MKDLAGQPAGASIDFTVDTLPPTIMTFTPAPGSVIASAQPTISAAFFDATSGVDPASVHLTLDGADVTGQASVTESSISVIPSAGLADGEHTAGLILADRAGHQTSAQTSFTIQTTVEPRVTPRSGVIHGTVFDALTEAPLDVQATEYAKADHLPGPLPETSFFTYALDLQPDGATFSAPVIVRLANSRNFAAGTPIPVGLYNYQTGAWEHESMAQVTPDGQWVEFHVTHFSPRDINLPPALPDPRQEAPEPSKVLPLTPLRVGAGVACPIGSDVCPGSGDLRLEHALPTIRTLGISRGPVLVYRSMRVTPSQVIGAGYPLETQGRQGDRGTIVPETTTFSLQIEGRRLDAVFTGAEGKSRYAFLWDGRNARGEAVPTGVYPYTIELSNDYPGTFAVTTVFGGPPMQNTGVPTGELVPRTTKLAGAALVVNERMSPFGAGWGLSQLQRIVPQPDGTMLIADGMEMAAPPCFVRDRGWDLRRRIPNRRHQACLTSLLS